MVENSELLTGQVATALGVSAERVRQLSDRGELASRRVGARGQRLYRSRDVEVLRAARAANPPKPGRSRRDVESAK